MIKPLLLVATGGAIGSMARYLCQKWLGTAITHPFPWGTFAVNITGCLVIGMCWSFFTRNGGQYDNVKLFLMTGVCGGFTTFSAFSLENIMLLKENRITLFTLYTAGSVILGILATAAGIKLIRS